MPNKILRRLSLRISAQQRNPLPRKDPHSSPLCKKTKKKIHSYFFSIHKTKIIRDIYSRGFSPHPFILETRQKVSLVNCQISRTSFFLALSRTLIPYLPPHPIKEGNVKTPLGASSPRNFGKVSGLQDPKSNIYIKLSLSDRAQKQRVDRGTGAESEMNAGAGLQSCRGSPIRRSLGRDGHT